MGDNSRPPFLNASPMAKTPEPMFPFSMCIRVSRNLYINFSMYFFFWSIQCSLNAVFFFEFFTKENSEIFSHTFSRHIEKKIPYVVELLFGIVVEIIDLFRHWSGSSGCVDDVVPIGVHINY